MSDPVRPARLSEEALIAATGRGWADWKRELEQADAGELSHAGIARLLAEAHGVPGWWAQNLAVRFEQETGRRAPGQSCRGDFQASASRTMAGDLDEVFTRVCAHMAPLDALDGCSFAAPAETSATEKWRYWKVRLADGSRASVHVSVKSPGKVGVGVSHEKLDDPEAVARWKSWWKQTLGAM